MTLPTQSQIRDAISKAYVHSEKDDMGCIIRQYIQLDVAYLPILQSALDTQKPAGDVGVWTQEMKVACMKDAAKVCELTEENTGLRKELALFYTGEHIPGMPTTFMGKDFHYWINIKIKEDNLANQPYSALTGDCGGGDNNVELLKRIRHFLQQVFENRAAKQLTVQVHHHRADTIGSLAEDLRDQINKALTADNAKRGE